MDYYQMEKSLQVLFERHVPLSRAQNTRLRQGCVGALLAGSSQLSRIARWVKQGTQQDSRVQWLRRLLGTPFMTQEWVYYPWVKQALAHFKAPVLHVVMDRTHVGDGQTDLLCLALSFRQRGIPLAWDWMAHGSSEQTAQIALIERGRALLPAAIPVVFHGDGEFDSVPLLQYLRQLHWDYIVRQPNKKCFRQRPETTWQSLKSLPVTRRRPIYIPNIELTRRYGYGPVNLFAFYQPLFHKQERRRNITYCVTSLPITPTLRRLGQRRWGIECCFKDLKSSGWHWHSSDLTHPQRREGLLTLLNVSYLWATCLGRWLCKTGNRRQIDAQGQRHLSLFRLGWDWLVHRYNMDLPCPALLTLYQ